MKKITRIFTVLTVTFLMAQSAIAQTAITLEAFGGWLWTGSAGNNGNIKVDDKGNYGVRGGVSPGPGMVIEFEWNHTETTLQGYDYITNRNYVEDALMNYYLLGFNKEMSEGPAIPFGVFNLGVMNLKGVEENNRFSSNWFTVGLGGGLKYYFSDNVGIRLQARIFLPMSFGAVGFGCGGGGCGTNVSGYATTIQGDFTGGIILKFGGS